jgi:LmbE family N-acetylglucosaminyl deacetylase
MKPAAILPSEKRGTRRRFVLRLGLVCGLSAWIVSLAAASEPLPPSAIPQELRRFQELGSVLFIAAHPDDENNRLIAYLARGRHYRTAYLSLTRGDGGQNVLGPEFGETLGVIRTEELLAARQIDGGRQFFTRAIDFGFSKNPTETLVIWNRDQVLADMVRVIRSFRPDVLISRFSPTGGGHGHHTASAILAREVFKLCGDPHAYPDQLKDLAPWQPKRLFLNGGGFGRGSGGGNTDSLRVEVGGNDPITGESFASIAGRSRSMHKTQGFGNFTGGGGGGPATESFQLLAGEPARQDLLEGVNTHWSRFPGGADIEPLTAEIIARFDPQNPAASVPALLSLRGRLATLASDPVVDEKRRQLDRIVQACVGLSVVTTVPRVEVVPGETLSLQQRVEVHSSVPVRWMGVRFPSLNRRFGEPLELRPNQAALRQSTLELPAQTPLSQPYWLRAPHPPGMFQVNDPSLIGRPENPPALPIEQEFEINGQSLVIMDEPVQEISHAAPVESRRPLAVISPVALRFVSEVRLFAPGAMRPVEVAVTAYRPDVSGTVQLAASAGWKIEPARQPLRLAKAGEKSVLRFQVTAPAQPVRAILTASALINGVRFASDRIEIHYPHLPPLLLQPAARLPAVALEWAIRGRQVGYVPGAGDSVAESLEQMGYTVTRLAGADLTPEKLRGFDAVVIGIRAFNVRKDLGPQLPALFAYAEAGGNVLVQYNNPNGLQTNRLAPYDLRLSQDRVTDENASVTFLVPDHPALNTPNRITQADFVDWVQERGLYFPNQWDEHFTPVLVCGDPGEAPLKGGLLVAKYGQGYFVYTGLAWFRQLPAGVPGAYRLFANLVSLGK